MKFEYFKNRWELNEWQNRCPELTYKVVNKNELPDWLPSGLTDKFNSAVIASSGNTETYVSIIMGYRIDHDKIDEHPFVVAFDKNTNAEYGGFIEHGNWTPGRTTEIPDEMQRLITLSGLTVDFRFERKPEAEFGTLDDLKRQGILNGFESSVSIIEKKRKMNIQPPGLGINR